MKGNILAFLAFSVYIDQLMSVLSSGIIEVTTDGLWFNVLISSGLCWQIISVENENVFDFEVRLGTGYKINMDYLKSGLWDLTLVRSFSISLHYLQVKFCT